MAEPRIVPCPQCGKPVEWGRDSTWRPFCSERCKLIDLGAWASESYRIPVAPSPESDSAPTDESARDDASQN